LFKIYKNRQNLKNDDSNKILKNSSTKEFNINTNKIDFINIKPTKISTRNHLKEKLDFITVQEKY
jgi:hypothetical protein